MSLYKECLALVSGHHFTQETDFDTISLVSAAENSTHHSTAPSFSNNEQSGFMQRGVYYISDLHLVHHIIQYFSEPVSENRIKEYIHNIVLELFNGDFGKDVRSFKSPIVLFGGDISSSFYVAEFFYRDFLSTWNQIANKEHSIYSSKRVHPYVYSILGNHELWDFDSYGACEKAYKCLFDELNIVFLNNRVHSLGPFYRPRLFEYNQKEYDRQLLNYENIIIVGGLGFAALNPSFNANQGIYGTAIGRDEEIKRCEQWQKLIGNAVELAKQNHCSLVVLCHNPIFDWMDQPESFSNCFIFCGHTHRNVAYGGKNNTFVFADNQVGYMGKNFCFKKAVLHLPRNPFASDPDGYKEISCEEYKEYYRYVRETIPGTGIIEYQIKKYEAKLYVIKQEGYVGFFLSAPRGIYICNGGQIRKIGSPESLERYMKNFSFVIDKYITALSPLRQAQEKMSAFIKSFGGTGYIHGTIVDIDFFNHIMVNSIDGTLTIYNSPMFGLVKTYPNIGMLLHIHCPELEAAYLALGDSLLMPRTEEKTISESAYEFVDIKNSPYALSRRVNAIQRLFDKHILRDWNPELEIHQCELDNK